MNNRELLGLLQTTILLPEKEIKSVLMLIFADAMLKEGIKPEQITASLLHRLQEEGNNYLIPKTATLNRFLFEMTQALNHD